jgi:hypothetical protein
MTVGQGGAVPAPGDVTSGAAGGSSIQSLAQLLGGIPGQTSSSGWTAQTGGALGQLPSGAGLQYGGDLAGIPYQVWNQASVILGYDTRQAFLDYQRQYDPAGFETKTANEAETFLNVLLGAAAQSPTGWVVRRAEEYWASTYGGQMPQSVVDQIIQTVAQGGPSLARVLQTATFSTTVGGSLPSAIKTIVDNAAAMDPSTRGQLVSQEQAALAQSRIKQYVDTFGRAPGLDQQQVVAMDQQRWNDFLNNQQYRSGMTLGQYTDARTALDNAGWMNWFGAQPSDQDVKWAMGRSPEDITARIDQSPYSRIPGMNIGTYKGYSTEGDTISKALFGASLPDSLIKDMHNAGIKPS